MVALPVWHLVRISWFNRNIADDLIIWGKYEIERKEARSQRGLALLFL